MSVSFLDSLGEPLSDDRPGGEDLEDSQLLASFEMQRIFGQATPPADVDWPALKRSALEALATSRDLRLLTHLGAAVVRTDGLEAFCQVLRVGGDWMSRFPEAVYPQVVDDAIARKSALEGFADRMAVVDAVRRAPFVSNRQLGAFSLRDLDLAAGKLQRRDGDPEVTEAQIQAALDAAAPAELESMRAAVAAGLEALAGIERVMSADPKSPMSPDFGPLSAELKRLDKLLTANLAARADSAAAADDAGGAEPDAAAAPGARGVGAIRTREDAIRALDALATYFRQAEPSSAVPMFLERAKRLIGKNFLEVLADVVPDAVDQAKHIGGIRDEA